MGQQIQTVYDGKLLAQSYIRRKAEGESLDSLLEDLAYDRVYYHKIYPKDSDYDQFQKTFNAIVLPRLGYAFQM